MIKPPKVNWKLATDEIKLIRDRLVLESQLTIDNEVRLQKEIEKIKIEADIGILNKRKELAESGSKELERIELELQSKQNNLNTVNTDIENIGINERLEESILIAERIARSVSENEEELQLRLANVQLEGENKRLERRLENEKLTGEKRLAVEREIQDNINEIQNNNSDIDSISDNERLTNELNERLLLLAKEVDTLEEFEKRKSEIILESELARLEAEKERKIKAGEDLLEIEKEIALKELEIQEEKNSELLEKQKKRLAEQKKAEQQLISIQVEALQGLGAAFGTFFDQSKEDQKDFAKASLIVVLDAVEKTINLYLAQLLAKEVASKSFLGIGTYAVLKGIVSGVFGTAKASINANEEGALLMPQHKTGTVTRDIFSLRSHTPGDLKRGTIFQGYSHLSKGEPFSVGGKINEAEYGEAIINKKSTQKFKGLLSAINSYNGWGQKFQDGVLLGQETPNLLTVGQPAFGSVVITDEQMEMFALIVSQKQTESLVPIVDNIPNKISQGMEEGTRINERRDQAEQNGLV